MKRTETYEGFGDEPRLDHILKWGFVPRLSKSLRHLSVPSNGLSSISLSLCLSIYLSIISWFLYSYWMELQNHTSWDWEKVHLYSWISCRPTHLAEAFFSASVVGGAEENVRTLDRERLSWGLSGAWGPNPDDSSTLSSLFSLFHWKCPLAGPLVSLIANSFLSCKQNRHWFV